MMLTAFNQNVLPAAMLQPKIGMSVMLQLGEDEWKGLLYSSVRECSVTAHARQRMQAGPGQLHHKHVHNLCRSALVSWDHTLWQQCNGLS